MQIIRQFSKNSNQDKFPLVITVYGGINRGKVIEEKAACLAGKGFASLALAFFRVDDLPKSYSTQALDIEYFEEAIDLVTKRDDVDENNVGILGMSKGGEIALGCAAFLKEKVKACVLVNTFITNSMTPMVYKDQKVPCTFFSEDMSKIVVRDDGLLDVIGLTKGVETDPDTFIPFADCSASLLFVVGTDDHNSDSVGHVKMAQELMDKAGKINYEIMLNEGMGHICFLPYSPSVFAFAHPLLPPGALLYMGGSSDPKKHLQGQMRTWLKSIEFFRQAFSGK